MSHGPILVPFYLVVDVSQSMEGSRLMRVNQILRRLSSALAADPVANNKVRVCMIEFSGTARVVLPLCDLLNTATLPTLHTRDDGTRYGPVLDLLRATIISDARQLRADGFATGTPGAFILSDGEPYDDAPGDGEAALRRLLVECESPPLISPCAIAESDPDIMRALAHPRPTAPTFVQSRDASPEDAINSLIEIVVQSVLSSAHQETAVLTEAEVHSLDTIVAEPPEEWITSGAERWPTP